MSAHAVLVFVRAPEAGRVKTRLAAEVGDAAALRVYRRLAEHAVAQARALAPAAALRVHHTPARAASAIRAWLGDDLTHLPQIDAGLGERMRAAFEAAFAEGFRRVIIIGSDLPELTTELLRNAFDRLDAHPCVIGPAADGGYWLLGMREMIDGVFDGIAWSTDAVLQTTLDRLRARGIDPVLLPTLADVDTAADLPDGWLAWATDGEEVAA